MNLPDLDQVVQLARGEVAHVHRALRLVRAELLLRDPKRGQRLLCAELLALKPLSRLLGRLATVATRDARARGKAKARLRELTLPCDELTVLRLLYARLLATADQADDDDGPADLATDPQQRAGLLATALGKFHQRSLNLASHITLPPVLGPYQQGNLFDEKQT